MSTALLLALLPVCSLVPQEDPLTGLWWGGLSLPDEFEPVTLEIETLEGELVCRSGRPLDGVGAQPMKVLETTPRLIVEHGDEGETVTLDVALREADGEALLIGEARLGQRSAPLVLRRILALEPAELDPLVGDFVAESAERLRVERLPAATRHPVLACSWTLSGRERTLFPVERSADGGIRFVFGPDFRRAGPTQGSVTFAADGQRLEWSDRDGSGEPAERFVLPFDGERVARLVEGELERSGAPSISVGIVHGETLALARSFGVLNRETGTPATPDSLYQIASVTKVFTAALLLAMRDEGLVRLDDPVAGLLPDARLPVGGEGITLRQLVTHTSGLRLQPTNYRWNGRHNDDYTPELLLECLPQTSLLFPRGSRWSYSNLGFVLLGHALAQAGGASYEDLLRRHVLEPLGMTNSTVTLDQAARARLATHYWADDPLTPTPPWIPGTIAAQGGLTSSVTELARFVSASLRDERAEPGFVSAASLQEMQTPQARRGPDGWIGLSWFIDHDATRGLVLSHSGYTGGSSSYMALSPALEVGVICLTNFGFETAVRVGEGLLDEALKTAREHLVPSAHEAGVWLSRGDAGNAAWAYGVLTELFPDRTDLRRGADRARAALPGVAPTER
jgi:D-alanyl-D-alanine-carboxypeptidase/D-alanyl-D-alanine-endopeptidase